MPTELLVMLTNILVVNHNTEEVNGIKDPFNAGAHEYIRNVLGVGYRLANESEIKS